MNNYAAYAALEQAHVALKQDTTDPARVVALAAIAQAASLHDIAEHLRYLPILVQQQGELINTLGNLEEQLSLLDEVTTRLSDVSTHLDDISQTTGDIAERLNELDDSGISHALGGIDLGLALLTDALDRPSLFSRLRRMWRRRPVSPVQPTPTDTPDPALVRLGLDDLNERTAS